MLTLDAETIEAINSSEVKPLALYSIEYDDNMGDLHDTHDAWADGSVYSIGDFVTYDGTTYKCIKYHHSYAARPPAFDRDTFLDGLGVPEHYWPRFYQWEEVGAEAILPASPLRFTSWSESIVYEGNTYISWGIKHSGAKQSSDGKIQNVTLAVANIDEDRVIQRVIEDFDIIGSQVTIIEMFLDESGVIENSYTVVSARAIKGQVMFSLSMGFNFLNIMVPGRKAYRDHCRWILGDEYCKYSGAETTCDKTFKTCRGIMENSANYGGFLGIKNEIFWK